MSSTHNSILVYGQENGSPTPDVCEQLPLETLRQKIAEVLTANVDLSRAERIHLEAVPLLTWRISMVIYPKA